MDIYLSAAAKIRVKVYGLLAITILCMLLFQSMTLAYGWKPNTHIFLANEVLDDLCKDEKRTLEINGKLYKANPIVAEAICSYPEYFRGGAVGPDGFPDIVFGQGTIHPDLSDIGGSTSDEWLRYTYFAGWEYFEKHNGLAISGDGLHNPGQQALAFTYGFLSHAAGDVWAHTFVNEYAQGVFPGVSEVLENLDSEGRLAIILAKYRNNCPGLSEIKDAISSSEAWESLRIKYEGKCPATTWKEIEDAIIELNYAKAVQTINVGTRHLAVEAYVGKNTQPPDTTSQGKIKSNDIKSPKEFIKETFIWSDNMPPIAAFNLIEKYRSLHRWTAEQAENERVSASSCTDMVCTLQHQGLALYYDSWHSDIEKGLNRWPDFSEQVAQDLYSEGDFDKAKEDTRDFVLSPDGLASMSGVPSPILLYMEISGIMQAFKDAYDYLKEFFSDPLEFMIKQALGISLEEMKKVVKNPDNWLDNKIIPFLFPQGVIMKLDSVMGLDNENQSYFELNDFKPAKNSVVLIKMSILSEDSLNLLLCDNHLGPIYGQMDMPDNCAFKQPEFRSTNFSSQLLENGGTASIFTRTDKAYYNPNEDSSTIITISPLPFDRNKNVRIEILDPSGSKIITTETKSKPSLVVDDIGTIQLEFPLSSSMMTGEYRILTKYFNAESELSFFITESYDGIKRENPVLGFIRSLDGHEQWRSIASQKYPLDNTDSYGNGMPIWMDCPGRERIFKVLFEDWQHPYSNSGFSDAGEPAIPLRYSATPLPMTILENSGKIQVKDNTIQISSDSVFTFRVLDNSWWNPEKGEVVTTVSESYGNPLQTGRFDSVTGELTHKLRINEGDINFEYHSKGRCTNSLTGESVQEQIHRVFFEVVPNDQMTESIAIEESTDNWGPFEFLRKILDEIRKLFEIIYEFLTGRS